MQGECRASSGRDRAARVHARPRQACSSASRCGTVGARSPRPGLASSAIRSHLDAFVDDKLGIRELAHAWTTKDDVDASKPDPDIVEAALAKAGTSAAVMIGETPWDCEAAGRVGIPTVCVLTGGFSRAELRAAGAAVVHESRRALLERLDEPPSVSPT